MKHLFFIAIFLSIHVIPAYSQGSLDKVIGFFGNKKGITILEEDISTLSQPIAQLDKTKRMTYIAKRMSSLHFSTYNGKYVLPFKIEKTNSLTDESFVEIAGKKPTFGNELFFLPYGGNGKNTAMALPSLNEPDNLWFIKFSEIGTELNNMGGQGTKVLYSKAEDAINQGATAVMFLNDIGEQEDFKQPLDGQYLAQLTKPVWVLNYQAYQKYILSQNSADWISLSWKILTANKHSEGNNVVGFYNNRAAETIIISAKINAGELEGAADIAALLDIGKFISDNKLKNFNYLLVAYEGSDYVQLAAQKLQEQLLLNKSKINTVISLDALAHLSAENALFILGASSSPDWTDMLMDINRFFKTRYEDLVQKDDYSIYYDKEIPFLHLSAQPAKGRNKMINEINIDGVKQVSDGVASILVELDNSPKLRFTKIKEVSEEKMTFRVNMGIVPDYAYLEKGVRIEALTKGSNAEKAGLQIGDILIRLNAYDIKTMNDYLLELAKYRPKEKVSISLIRQGEKMTIPLTFD